MGLLVMTVCTVYMAVAFAWLTYRGMHETQNRLDGVIALGLVAAIGGFLVAMITDEPGGGNSNPLRGLLKLLSLFD